MKQLIAIDGYSSCGKSTLARQLAGALHYTYIDSGAMYRAITLYFIRNDINWNVSRETTEALKNIRLEFIPDPGTYTNSIYLNGENVEAAIREMAVAEKVSEVAAIEAVRSFAVSQQQEMGRKQNIVMDGRDVGTVVFPGAALKIFMTADPAIRAKRRFAELQQKNKTVTLEDVRKNLEQRDEMDTSRKIGPLRQAADAIVLDNSMMTPEEQLQFAIKLASDVMK